MIEIKTIILRHDTMIFSDGNRKIATTILFFRLTNKKQSVIGMVITAICVVCQLSVLVVIPLLSNTMLGKLGSTLTLDTIGMKSKHTIV